MLYTTIVYNHLSLNGESSLREGYFAIVNDQQLVFQSRPCKSTTQLPIDQGKENLSSHSLKIALSNLRSLEIVINVSTGIHIVTDIWVSKTTLFRENISTDEINEAIRFIREAK